MVGRHGESAVAPGVQVHAQDVGDGAAAAVAAVPDAGGRGVQAVVAQVALEVAQALQLAGAEALVPAERGVVAAFHGVRDVGVREPLEGGRCPAHHTGHELEPLAVGTGERLVAEGVGHEVDVMVDVGVVVPVAMQVGADVDVLEAVGGHGVEDIGEAVGLAVAVGGRGEPHGRRGQQRVVAVRWEREPRRVEGRRAGGGDVALLGLVLDLGVVGAVGNLDAPQGGAGEELVVGYSGLHGASRGIGGRGSVGVVSTPRRTHPGAPPHHPDTFVPMVGHFCPTSPAERGRPGPRPRRSRPTGVACSGATL